MPETTDSDFSEEELVRRNNDELVSTWGNLVNRVLTFTYRNFDGRVPDPGALREQDEALLAAGRRGARSRSARASTPASFREGLRSGAGLRPGDEPLPRRRKSPGRRARPTRGRRRSALHGARRHRGAQGRASTPSCRSPPQKLHECSATTARSRRGGWDAARPEPGAALQEPAAAVQEARPAGAGEVKQAPLGRLIALVDTHAHIQEPEFDDDRTPSSSAPARPASCRWSCRRSTSRPRSAPSRSPSATTGVYATAGFHPHEANAP